MDRCNLLNRSAKKLLPREYSGANCSRCQLWHSGNLFLTGRIARTRRTLLLCSSKVRFRMVMMHGAVICLSVFHLSQTILHPKPFSVTMYNYHRQLFAKSNIEKQYFSHRVNDVCNGSPSRIRSVLRISLGITIRPRSSTRRTMPVAFMLSSPLKAPKRGFVR